jgi:DUF1680 family protein
VTLKQETGYPETETSTMTVNGSGTFALKMRVPGWSRDMSITVNGKPSSVHCQPGEWATIERAWSSGDRVEVRIPLQLRYQAVDRQHPHPGGNHPRARRNGARLQLSCTRLRAA